ncbi:MAG: hypothetical protein LUH05_03025 [Candidatus Gastranaerophilales bacterium]|nr:hypothetical protein [Candidatus Gastranaerophilales bacterium]
MYKNKTAEILYNQMIMANENEVSKTALYILDKIQTFKVKNQLLGLASAIICLLEEYDLSSSDLLGIAHNIVYTGSNGNVNKDFKAIKHYVKNEWNLLEEH